MRCAVWLAPRPVSRDTPPEIRRTPGPNTPKNEEILRRDSGFRNISPATPPGTPISPLRRLFQKPECLSPVASLLGVTQASSGRLKSPNNFRQAPMIHHPQMIHFTPIIHFAPMIHFTPIMASPDSGEPGFRQVSNDQASLK